MIYTVTFNPAIDYVMQLDGLCLGKTNRANEEKIYYGGKGINVSAVLKELGFDSVALGFVAGFVGEEICKGVQKMGICSDFVQLPTGNSRINVKIKHGEETEINAQGPNISEEALSQFMDKLNKLKSGDVLILAGSVPKSLPDNIYEKIVASKSPKNVKVIVDASGKLLLNVLKYKPYLIKPNKQELEDIFDIELKSEEEIIKYALKLKEKGAQNVLVSLGSDGALLIDEYGIIHKCKACKGKLVNSVGAGDSMVAGFVAGMQEGDYDYALKLGIAAGGATAFSLELARSEDIKTLFNML